MGTISKRHLYPVSSTRHTCVCSIFEIHCVCAMYVYMFARWTLIIVEQKRIFTLQLPLQYIAHCSYLIHSNDVRWCLTLIIIIIFFFIYFNLECGYQHHLEYSFGIMTKFIFAGSLSYDQSTSTNKQKPQEAKKSTHNRALYRYSG